MEASFDILLLIDGSCPGADMDEMMFEQLWQNGQDIYNKKYCDLSKKHETPFDFSGIVESFSPHLHLLPIHQLDEKIANLNKKLKEMPYRRLEMSDDRTGTELIIRSVESHILTTELYALQRLRHALLPRFPNSFFIDFKA